MAKRFIDTGLFRQPRIRAMQAPYKALFVYLLCECDHAGLWDVELDVAAMRLGMRLDESKALESLAGAVVPVCGGKKWWLVDFVEYQYGELNPSNRVHASVMSRLQALGLNPKEAPSKPLVSPLEGAKDKDKDTTQDRKERAREELIWPILFDEDAKAKWDEFVEYKAKEHGDRYKTSNTEQRALDLACKMFPTGRMLIEALDHTMARRWRFPVNPSEHKYPFTSEAAKSMPKPEWNPRA